MESQRRRSYVMRHVKGELPLSLSLWVNMILVDLLFAGLILFLITQVFTRGNDPEFILGVGLILFVPLILIQGIGVQIAAVRHAREKGGKIYGAFARILSITLIWASAYIAARLLINLL